MITLDTLQRLGEGLQKVGSVVEFRNCICTYSPTIKYWDEQIALNAVNGHFILLIAGLTVVVQIYPAYSLNWSYSFNNYPKLSDILA